MQYDLQISNSQMVRIEPDVVQGHHIIKITSHKLLEGDEIWVPLGHVIRVPIIATLKTGNEFIAYKFLEATMDCTEYLLDLLANNDICRNCGGKVTKDHICKWCKMPHIREEE